jgi:hypothetical protein
MRVGKRLTVGAAAFLASRLDGKPVPNGCSSIGVGNSLAPLPVPRRAP